MDNRLFFNANDWILNPKCTSNKGTRNVICGVDGTYYDAVTIGSWGNDLTELISPLMNLTMNSDYTLTFWLNGGENDRNGDEVCQLHIIFDQDNNHPIIYNLNRSFVRPVKRIRGWNLYEIPFRTYNNTRTQFKFVAKCAYTTIMVSKGKEAYAEMKDELDEFEGLRPQRHNLMFADGWPNNQWYSTMELRKKYQGKEWELLLFGKDTSARYQMIHDMILSDIDMNAIQNKIIEELNLAGLRKEIFDQMDLKAMSADIMKQLDINSMRERIVSQVVQSLKEKESTVKDEVQTKLISEIDENKDTIDVNNDSINSVKEIANEIQEEAADVKKVEIPETTSERKEVLSEMSETTSDMLQETVVQKADTQIEEIPGVEIPKVEILEPFVPNVAEMACREESKQAYANDLSNQGKKSMLDSELPKIELVLDTEDPGKNS